MVSTTIRQSCAIWSVTTRIISASTARSTGQPASKSARRCGCSSPVGPAMPNAPRRAGRLPPRATSPSRPYSRATISGTPCSHVRIQNLAPIPTERHHNERSKDQNRWQPLAYVGDLAAANHRAGLSTADEAIRRRIHMLPFTLTIPEERVDNLPRFLMRGS
ncbi:hypothetical protein BQ8482_540016 [Mesorhizobium delmotii]|uniref:Uncharacterized protein n=1 Tax=Mesorhizobium delmotii TaxID=1631247 RepID=A0A2P9AUM9_9HYPH|nr:hypothetical protein BQ8482_540016 [Mesorhizobium delmotii]